jgi:non-canonical (house-cleaning) NTP pyrophosphatase
MKIGITSENKLKINAVEKAYSDRSIEIKGYSTDSGVGEQPVNEQTLKGARNRIADLEKRVHNLGLIFSIENGIFYENGKWVDRAVVLVKDTRDEKEYVAYSEGVVFPEEFVKRAKEIGFDKITVGKVMADADYVKDAKDPHLSISGISRQKYLETAISRVVVEIA